jgi:sugar lactone lactonase YvrE
VTDIISTIRPEWVVPGAPVTLGGRHLPVPADGPPHVLVGTEDARVLVASADRLRIVVPPTADGGTMAVRIDELPGATTYLQVARQIVTGIHQVDSPLVLADGTLVVTQSGGRGTSVPAPLFRVPPGGAREPIEVPIANPTSLAVGPDGAIYVSSRFEGSVYRMAGDQADVYAGDLGVPTGLAFAPDGALFVGDRSGSIIRIGGDRQVESFAALPGSVAAFHLAFGPDDCLYVTGPTLSTHDAVYRITPDRLVETVHAGLGRPQGLTFDDAGALYVADALAGSAGLFRVDVSRPDSTAELVVGAPALVGVAFDPGGGLVLASNDTVWRLDADLKPLRSPRPTPPS